jgi:hypothetical protein
MSAEGRLLVNVAQFRVGVENPWSTAPYALTLIVVLESDVLPVFPDDTPPDIPEELDGFLRPDGHLVSVDKIAARLEATTDTVERYWLWLSLGEAWAAKCEAKPKDLKGLTADEQHRVLHAVEGDELHYEVVSEDRFTMAEYNASEMLDLDHLSPSWPLVAYSLDEPVRSPDAPDRSGTASDLTPQDDSSGAHRRAWARMQRILRARG